MYGEHLNQNAEIRVFTENDREACQAIWLACFPEDTPEAPEHFFRDVLHRGEGLVYQTGGRRFRWFLCCRRNSSVKTGGCRSSMFMRRRPTRIISTAGFLPRCCAVRLTGRKPGNGGIVPASGRAGSDRLLCRIRLPAVFYPSRAAF